MLNPQANGSKVIEMFRYQSVGGSFLISKIETVTAKKNSPY